jgi:hypothetical protein
MQSAVTIGQGLVFKPSVVLLCGLTNEKLRVAFSSFKSSEKNLKK